MHPNPAYRQTPRARNLAFCDDRSFGTLAVNADAGPLLSHVPFQVFEPEGDTRVDLHMVRSNPIIRLLDAGPVAAVLAVTGPDSYISPDWYELADQVPTWNYVAVHLRGTLQRLPDDALRPLLDDLSAHFEARLAPKPPWLSTKMPAETLDRMMRMIVPCRLRVHTVEGTWKLAQNKPDAARIAAADRVEAAGIGVELAALAKAMRAAGEA